MGVVQPNCSQEAEQLVQVSAAFHPISYTGVGTSSLVSYGILCFRGAVLTGAYALVEVAWRPVYTRGVADTAGRCYIL